jgi:glycosyltransferase involved in cell wall biosynthesis
MPTPTWAAHFGELWGADIAVVSNGHELEPVSSPPPAAPVLAYLGSFNPGRQSLASLWKGVEGLRRSGQSPMPRVRFIGDLHPAAQEEAVAAGLEGLVEATGVVPHEAATALIEDSSMLFTSGDVGRDAIARGWVPAKLFEYLATGLPILYVGDPAGDAWALLSGQPGCYVVEPADVEGITSALQAGLTGPRTHGREVSHLSRRAAAATLAAILDKATVTSASSR